MFLFAGLRRRTVLVNLVDGSMLRGEVLRAGVLTSRISQPAIMGPSGAQEIQGVVRIPHRSIISIQEF
jgi:hypothetical protein